MLKLFNPNNCSKYSKILLNIFVLFFQYMNLNNDAAQQKQNTENTMYRYLKFLYVYSTQLCAWVTMEQFIPNKCNIRNDYISGP
jgi:succinate dehydrogenase hydrophobic anchor subunit